MKGSFLRGWASAVLLVVAAACGGVAREVPAPASSGSSPAPAPQPRPNPNRPPASEADVRFMTKMIPHHGQAVLFAGWAPTHGASRSIQVLCERIVVAQGDEIRTMQNWLLDHGEPAPDPDAGHMMHGADHQMPGMAMGDMQHESMPGMLSAEQLEQLDAARGAEFDRLFLTFMIEHHKGAVAMVDELFTSYGGAQDDVVFKLASDIYADQTTEIDRMQKMLAALVPG